MQLRRLNRIQRNVPRCAELSWCPKDYRNRRSAKVMVLGLAGMLWLTDYSCIEKEAVAQEATKQSSLEIASRILRQRNGPRRSRSQAQRETLQRQGKWRGFAVED